METQVQIESADAGLYGTMHTPSRDAVGGVVVCNPAFEERKSASRALVEAARALRGRGYFVLTFDYRGCGDSPGAFHDYTTSHWKADTRAAVAFLRAHAGPGPLGVLGLRLGAALAVDAAAHNPAIAFLALWEPVTKGRAYLEQELRKKLVKQMVTFGKGRETRESLLDDLQHGREIDFDGYALSPALYRDLCEIDLMRSAGDVHVPTLLVNVTGSDKPSPPLRELHERLTAAGCAASLEKVRLQPFWNLIGYADCAPLIERTADWLTGLTT